MRHCCLIYGVCKAGPWPLQVLNRVIVSGLGWELDQIFSFAQYYLPVSTPDPLLRAEHTNILTGVIHPLTSASNKLLSKLRENALHLFITVCK